MDIHIQGHTDCIETARVVYEQYQIPVIFLTAYSEAATLVRAKKSKPYGYLLKPYSERELHAGIQVALEKNQADRKARDTQVHLQLALVAGNLSTWEAGGTDADVVLCYTANGRMADASDWQTLLKQIVPEAPCNRSGITESSLQDNVGNRSDPVRDRKARRDYFHRRLRHGLFLFEFTAHSSDSQAQDRPGIRSRHTTGRE